ncbi:MAG: hypothetical protein ACKO8W_04335 [Dolichospermum sp.]
MRYTTGGQDTHPTRVLLLKFVPHSNGICCIYRGFRSYEVHIKPPPRTPLNPPAAGGRKG